MDLERVRKLDSISPYHRVAVAEDGTVVAFLLCFGPKLDYESINYAWWNTRYEDFIYSDRIVVDPNFKRQGLGSMLYNDLFGWAKTNKIGLVTAEVNYKPPNEPSLAFHAKMGFKQVDIFEQSPEYQTS